MENGCTGMDQSYLTGEALAKWRWS